MFLRAKSRLKDGKVHRYWSIVENRRTQGNRIVQRQVLYLGEINDNQQAAWCKTIEVLQEGQAQPQAVAIFPEDRIAPVLGCEIVSIKLSELQLHRPRQWGACWLACQLWDQLRLDEFWSDKLPASRQGTRWLNVFTTLVCYRLISWGRILVWCKSTSCIGVRTSCCPIRRTCLPISSNAGRRCSRWVLRCFSTI